MAIVRYAGNRMTGVSGDSKPTSNVIAGTTFQETNTDDLYMWDGSSWNIVAGNSVAQTFSSKTFSDHLTVAEISAPGTPSSGYGALYVKSADSKLYFKNDGGAETDLTAGAAGGEANEASFKTIVVSGQDNVVADTTTDTLTLVAGSGMTITTTTGTDTVTFVSSAATLDGLSDTDIGSPGSAHVLIYDGSNTWDNKAVSGDISIGTDGAVAIASAVVVNADINASAAIAYSKLAALTDGNILVGNGSDVATSVNPSGDIDVTNAGVFSIASGVIVNADVNASAAIDYSKLAALTDGNIIVGNGSNVATSVNPSGDIDVTNAGVFSIATGVIVDADVNGSAAIAVSKLAASAITIGGTAVTLGNTITALTALTDLDLTAGDKTILDTVGSNDLTIGAGGTTIIIPGNLTVSGTTTISTTNLAIEDSMIALAAEQTSGTNTDALDVGFYGTYRASSTTKYAGLFRDVSDSNKWKFFDVTGNSNAVPGTTVDTSSGFILGDLAIDALTVASIGAFTATGAIDFDSQNMTNVDIDSGTVNGITSLTIANNIDVGNYTVRANNFLADSHTAGRVFFAGTDGVLTTDSDLTFSTDTLTVTKIGAFTATGAIDFDNQNLTNVDIDSGAIDGTAIGANSASTVVATQVDITAQGDIRLQDTTGGQYVGFQAPGTVASSVLWTLPSADGTNTQLLQTNGSGVLSWAASAAGSLDGLSDTNLTSPADASLLLYDTGTSTWRDAAMSGDATISDTGALTVAATAIEGSMLNANTVDDSSIQLASNTLNVKASGVTNAMLAGSIVNAKLVNSSITVSDGSNTSPVALGGTLTFTATANETTVAESAGTVTIGLPDNVTIAGNLIVTGNSTVNGDTITQNVATVLVEDPLMALASGNTTNSVDIGFFGKYRTNGTDLYTGLVWDGSASQYILFHANQAVPTTTVNTSGTGHAVSTLVANITGDVTGDVTGNASTATALQNARTIGGTSFNGTANIVPATITVAATSDSSSYVALFESATGNLAPKTNAGVTYNASTGTLSATSFSGSFTGTITEATNITAVANNSTDETVYPTFVDGATGTQGIETDTGLTYNPSSGILTSTTFVGTLTGNVTGDVSGSSGSSTGNAATSTEATNITAVANNSTNETVYPTFVDGATGTQGIETDTGLTYNPNTGVLTSTTFAGAVSGTATVATTVTVTDNESTNENNALVFVADADLDGGNVGLESDGDLHYNPSTGTLTATTFAGALSGNVSTATEATNITAVANNSTDETVYPTFVDGATGTQGIETDTGLTYNPSTGTITSTVFVGALTGNVTGNASGTAATVTGATQSAITAVGTLTSLTVSGATALNGAVTLGDASGDTVTITGTIGATGWATANHAHAASNSGGLVASSSLSGTVAINQGGTGQTTQTASFDALAPTTTAGDVIYYNGTDNVRLGIGSATEVLKTNTAGNAPVWEADLAIPMSIALG